MNMKCVSLPKRISSDTVVLTESRETNKDDMIIMLFGEECAVSLSISSTSRNGV